MSAPAPMVDPTPMVELVSIGKVYAGGTPAEVVALRGVSLRIDRGEFVAIMGASGSGKSTLMNLVGCLDTPSTGTYRCEGIDVATLDAEARASLRGAAIGFVFQSFNLLGRMTALDNVAMPMAYTRVPVSERRERALAALAEVGLADRASHRPGELSGGQQQRVAIARALINRPPLLLADEPTGALDSQTGDEIMALFKRLCVAGHTVILITHDRDIAEYADRICLMRDGELREDLAHAGRTVRGPAAAPAHSTGAPA